MRILVRLVALSLASGSIGPAGGQTRGLEAPTAQQIIATAQDLIEDAETVYVSDYFSFAGLDGEAPVAFALDTNRGRSGSAYQAEHFVALYDGRSAGWVEIPGYAAFKNAGKALAEFPESPYFSSCCAGKIALPVRALAICFARSVTARTFKAST